MENSDDMLERILAAGPSPGTVHVVLSNLLAQGHNGVVIRESLKAVRAFPGDVGLRSLLSQAYLKAGFVGLAEAELDAAAGCLKQLCSVYRLQAEIYRLQNRPTEAAGALKRYLAVDPDNPEALALLEALNESPEAVRGDAALPPEGPSPSEAPGGLATPTLAEIYYNQGRLKDAMTTYERVLAQDPLNEKAAGRLSELRQEAGGPPGGGAVNERIRAQKEKLAGILETWLEKIKAIDDI